MTSRERVLMALRCKQPDMVPFMDSYIDPGIQEILLGENLSVPTVSHTTPGFFSWGSFNKCEKGYSFRMAYSISPEFADRFFFDAFCIDYLPPLFVESGFTGSEEMIKDGLLVSKESLKIMDELPDPDDPSLYELTRKVIAECRDYSDKAIGARGRIGVSPTLLSMGMESFSIALHFEPGLIEEVMGRYTTWTAKIVQNLNEIGLDFLWFFDDIASNSGSIVSPQTFRDFFMPNMRRVASVIELPWVFHSDGNLWPLMDDLLSLGMNGIHPIQPDVMDIKEVKEKCGDKVCILGNIGVDLLARGTPAQVDSLVKERIHTIGKGGGYIITSGNSIPYYCKPENVRAFCNAVRKYRRIY